MKAAPEDARSIALHAGQIVRLVTQIPTRGTTEPSSFFYAAVCLFLFAESLDDGQEPGAAVVEGTAVRVSFALDGLLGEGQDAVGFVVGGGECVLKGVGRMGARGAQRKVLERMGEVLHGVGGTWRVGQMMAGVLRRMVRGEELQ